ncbi:MAG: hypothetical protein LBC75_10150 [Fibromonadaceae bacterium]|jgi:hypothetical protein|nr:hypothetical protein [Fibromonadaceae bacterium]
MKNLPILFATALLALFSASCTNGSDEPQSTSSDSQGSVSSSSQGNVSSSSVNNNSTSNGNCDSQAAENGQAYQYEEAIKYTRGDLTIYIADKGYDYDNREFYLKEKTMIKVGTMNNGEVSLVLPPNVDSRFLFKIEEEKIPDGMEIEPLGVEVLIYPDKLRLVDKSGKYIGDLVYAKKASDTEFYFVDYWYFSENAKINGTTNSEKIEYKIDAKKGWNKVYRRAKLLTDQSSESYLTTDLCNIPDGLKWIVSE